MSLLRARGSVANFDFRGKIRKSTLVNSITYRCQNSRKSNFATEPFEDADNIQWQEYCRIASTIDRTRILEVVLSDLDADDSPLYELIDDAIATPHEPGRPKESITKLAQLGQSLLNLIAKATDDQVNLRLATGGRVA